MRDLHDVSIKMVSVYAMSSLIWRLHPSMARLTQDEILNIICAYYAQASRLGDRIMIE